MNTTYQISNSSNRVFTWSLTDVLNEINRERSDEWEDYDETDWKEGWAFWVETNPDEDLTMIDKDDELIALCERFYEANL